jgi:O-antigen/teichoic acid export membrane protein
MTALGSNRAQLGRLIKGGLPTIVGSGVAALVPLSGSFFLSDNDYSIWALAATLSTIFIIFDFGTTSLSTKLAAERRVSRATLFRLMAITGASPLIIGAVVAVIWPTYTSAANLAGASGRDGYTLLATVAAGTILRSFGVVYASLALGRHHYRNRAAIVLVGSIAQAIVTVTMLATGVGFLSLGWGILIGGAIQVITGFALERKTDSVTTDLEVGKLIIMFVKNKGLGTLLGLTATQLDRWALGLTGNHALLTDYDLATRFATMPKIALLAFGAGLVSEAAASKDPKSTVALLRTSFRTTALLYVAGSVFTIGAGAILLTSRDAGTVALLVLFTVALAHGFNSLTIPSGLILTGLGRPDFELRYLWPLAIGTLISYAVGLAFQQAEVLIAGWAVSMIVFSFMFVIKSRKYVRESYEHL